MLKPSQRIPEIELQLAKEAMHRKEFRDWGHPDEEDKKKAMLQCLDELYDMICKTH